MDVRERTERVEQTPGPMRRRWRKAPPPTRACPNCGTWMDDAFCPRCGQRNASRLVSVRRFARDALEDNLAVDGKLPRTLGGLLFRPGFLTREYLEGRVVRYVSPLRLYLAGSVLFFLALASLMDVDRMWERMGREIEEMDAALPADVPKRNVNLGIDTTWAPGWMDPLARRVLRQEDRINALPPREAMRVEVAALKDTAPKVMFLVVPVMAAFLKLLYFRRRRLYAEHLVFALHFHAMAFLLAAPVLWLNRGVLWWALSAWLTVYLLLAMKRVYAQSWPRTAAKFVVVLVLYAAAGVVIGTATLVGSILAA